MPTATTIAEMPTATVVEEGLDGETIAEMPMATVAEEDLDANRSVFVEGVGWTIYFEESVLLVDPEDDAIKVEEKGKDEFE